MATIRRLPTRSNPVGKKKSPRRETPTLTLAEPESAGVVPPFESLEERLRERLKTAHYDIERILKDIERDLSAYTPQKSAEPLSRELLEMRGRLQKKIRDTFVNLAKRTELTREEDRNLELLSRLISQLVQFLSVDFYRDVLQSLANFGKQDEYDEFGLDHTLIKRIKPLFDFLYYKYWRVEVKGINHIPSKGPALLVANHSGTLPYDGAMIKAAVLNEHLERQDARFLVEDFVYHFPFLGTLMYRIGGVRASPENAERLLREGHLVIVFPEGVKGIGKLFKERYQLQRFGRGGFIRLALRTGAPIIPVAVIGAEEIHPLLYKSNILAKPLGIPYVPITPTMPWLGPLGLIPLPSKWSIHFGEPIHLKPLDEHAKDEDLYVHQTSEEVRSKIQDMISDNLRKRQSVWWG